MLNIVEYKQLVLKYGSHSSWAIWDYKKESDASIIGKNFNQLHSKFVLLALNASGSIAKPPWSNFRGGKHDRKLKYACNDTQLRGSYITDIFKDIPEPKSRKIKSLLTDEIIDKNVSLFNQEMRDIGINELTQFIVLGAPNSLLSKYFNNHFRQNYKNHITYYYHYSYYRLTDRAWVEGFWKKLGINQNFDLAISKYT
jgi:hypothetical protein